MRTEDYNWIKEFEDKASTVRMKLDAISERYDERGLEWKGVKRLLSITKTKQQELYLWLKELRESIEATSPQRYGN